MMQHRPDHPDLWNMARIVKDLDRVAEESSEEDMVLSREVSKHVDNKSSEYLATQRAMRAFGVTTAGELKQHFEQVVRGAALHMEGFIVGSRLAEQRIKDTPIHEMGEMEVRITATMYDIYVANCFDEGKKPLRLNDWLKER